MISDQRAEKAVEFIRDNAQKLAQAKAERVYMEEYRKSKHALLYGEATGTVSDREKYGYGHKDYIAVLEAIREAVAIEEKLRWEMVAAQATVEVWRTQQSTARAEGRAVR